MSEYVCFRLNLAGAPGEDEADLAGDDAEPSPLPRARFLGCLVLLSYDSEDKAGSRVEDHLLGLPMPSFDYEKCVFFFAATKRLKPCVGILCARRSVPLCAMVSMLNEGK